MMKNNIFGFLKKYWAFILLAILIVLYTSYFSFLTFKRHDNLYSMRYDLGNMDQTVWNTSRGRIFTLTNPDINKNVSRFMIHSDFFLIFLSPLYYIFPSPKTLLFVQSLFLALGALPVFFLSKKLFKKNIISLCFSFSYLLFPAIQRANIYEFHAVTIGTAFLLYSFYFAYIKSYKWFFIFAFLACSTKEQIPLLTAGIGLFIFIKIRDRLIGLLTILLSILWFVLAIWVVIPSYRVDNSHFATGFYSQYGETPGEIIIGVLNSPIIILKTIFSEQRINYIITLLAPVGFLPIFSPLVFLISLPDLLINLLSKKGSMQSIYYQYASGISPFIFLSSILGANFLIKKFRVSQRAISIYLLIFTLIGAYFLGPLPFSKKNDLNIIKYPHPNAETVKNISKTIPEGASVSVTNNIAPHFTHHEYVYVFPYNSKSADYNIVLAKGRYESIPSDKLPLEVGKIKNDPNYKLILEEGDFFVFKKL